VGVGVGVAVAVALGVMVAAGVDPVSVGSPVAAGVVVVLGVVLLSHAPRVAARLNIRAKPKIFVFITPLSPIVAIKNFRLLNTITYLLLFFKLLPITYLKPILEVDSFLFSYSVAD
jgi:hypothetical protein